MRPWMGALAATAAIALLPASALADDGQSVIEFKLPNKAAADQLINQGFDLGDGLDQSHAGLRQGDDRRHARAEGAARGDGLPGGRHDPDAGRRRRAARRAQRDDRRRDGRQGRAEQLRGQQEQERRRRHGPRAARRLLGGRRRTLALDRGHDDAGRRSPPPTHATPARSSSRPGTTPTARSSARGNLSALPRHRRHAARRTCTT